jgi:hypothetical protein
VDARRVPEPAANEKVIDQQRRLVGSSGALEEPTENSDDHGTAAEGL